MKRTELKRKKPMQRVRVSGEEWRAVVGYEGRYEVSDLGNVRALERAKQTERQTLRWPAKNLRAFPSSKKQPYLCVNLCDGERAVKTPVHLIVLEAFVGPRPEGMEGCHGDGNPMNASRKNLRWDTPKTNQADKLLHGTDQRGEKSVLAILSEEKVRRIHESKESSFALAPKMGVASSTIRAIRCGQIWGHLQIPKTLRFESEPHRRLVASLPCIRCGRVGFTQHAHMNFGKGMGRKQDDRLAFPLCADGPQRSGCHAWLDTSGAQAKDERRRWEARAVLDTIDTVVRAGLWIRGMPLPDMEELRRWAQ